MPVTDEEHCLMPSAITWACYKTRRDHKQRGCFTFQLTYCLMPSATMWACYKTRRDHKQRGRFTFQLTAGRRAVRRRRSRTLQRICIRKWSWNDNSRTQWTKLSTDKLITTEQFLSFTAMPIDHHPWVTDVYMSLFAADCYISAWQLIDWLSRV